MTAWLLVAVLAQSPFLVSADYVERVSWSQSSDALALDSQTGRSVANLSSWAIASAEAVPFVLDAFKHHTKVCTATKTALTAATVQGLKRLVRRERPDHSDRLSFPSGHTAYAALMMPHGSGWYVSLPVAVGAGRILAGRHDWLDVVGGAAIGFGVRTLPCH